VKLSRRLALAALAATTVALTLGAGVAAAAPISDPPPSAVIDPDSQQVDENGVLPGAPDPGRKAGAPAKDTKAHPEKSQTQQQADAAAEKAKRDQSRVAADEHAKKVVSSEPAPDGLEKVSVWEPVPGVSHEELAEKLKASGKKNVQVIDEEPPSGTASAAATPADTIITGPDDCDYGYAVTWKCLPTYWTDNGYVDPIVRVNDHASGAWTTDQATYKWNALANVDMRYIWDNCPFMAGARCVDVINGNYGESGWIGVFSYYQNASDGRKFYEPNATYPQQVKLNDWYNPAGGPTYGAFNRDQVVVHELGHVWGLGHNTHPNDVMYANAGVGVSANVGGENSVLVSNIYSIPR
jgi:hypothetical protein